jgi:hypothetical protein
VWRMWMGWDEVGWDGMERREVKGKIERRECR